MIHNPVWGSKKWSKSRHDVQTLRSASHVEQSVLQESQVAVISLYLVPLGHANMHVFSNSISPGKQPVQLFLTSIWQL